MVEKIKVSTKGDYMMQDPTTGEVVEAYGESEVIRSAWIEQQIAEGKLVSDTKIDKDDLKNPGSELDAAQRREEAEESDSAPQTNDQPVRAKAEQGEKRGASQTKRPENIDRVKTA